MDAASRTTARLQTANIYAVRFMLLLVLGFCLHAQTGENVLLVVNRDRKSTRLNSSHANISYAVFCLNNRSDRKSTRLNSSHANISYAVFWLKKTERRLGLKDVSWRRNMRRARLCMAAL